MAFLYVDMFGLEFINEDRPIKEDGYWNHVGCKVVQLPKGSISLLLSSKLPDGKETLTWEDGEYLI